MLRRNRLAFATYSTGDHSHLPLRCVTFAHWRRLLRRKDETMSFNKNSRLDPSQVEDRRGRRGTGTVVAVGGGVVGLIITIVIMLLGGNVGGPSIPDTGQGSYATEAPGGINDLQTQCQTGADANTREDCRIVGYVNSIQSFWSDEFARRGSQYTEADTVLFTGSTDAACGTADKIGRAHV